MERGKSNWLMRKFRQRQRGHRTPDETRNFPEDFLKKKAGAEGLLRDKCYKRSVEFRSLQGPLSPGRLVLYQRK